MQSLLNVAQIIAAVVLVAAILLQAKGSGIGNLFGSDSSVFRTRRGLERTLFRFTIAWAVLFLVLAIMNVRLASP